MAAAMEGIGGMIVSADSFKGFFEVLPHAFRDEDLRVRLFALYRWWYGLNLRWLGLPDEIDEDTDYYIVGLAELIAAIPDGLSIQGRPRPGTFRRRAPSGRSRAPAAQLDEGAAGPGRGARRTTRHGDRRAPSPPTLPTAARRYRVRRNQHAGRRRSTGASLNLLSDDDLHDIHLATLEVLEKTGVWVEDEEARRVFASAGADVDEATGVVKIPPYVVEEAVRSAPPKFVAAGRDPARDFVLEADRVGFTNFGEGVKLVDPFTGELRLPVKTGRGRHGARRRLPV